MNYHIMIYFTLLIVISRILVVAAETTESLKFLLLGDWGKGGNSGSIWNKGNLAKMGINDDDSSKATTSGEKQQLYQAAIASAMDTYSMNTKPTPSFVVALGDNFYTKGVSSTTDSNWKYLWEDVYLIYSSLNIPWYPVLGNHDYGGSRFAQIDRYKENPSGMWIFPGFNYTRKYDIPGGGILQIVFIDTTTLAPSVNKATNENGGISTSIQAARIQDQLNHIKAILDETLDNPPTWLLMAGHYPVFSVGSHGDTNELVKYKEIFSAYNIHAYLCGHDHISEHLRYKNTEYFVAGAGSMTDSLGSVTSEASVIWTGTGYSAFAVMEATISTLNISYIDASNTVKYKYSLHNPNTNPNMIPTLQPIETIEYEHEISNTSSTPYFSQSAVLGFGGAVFIVLILGLSVTRTLQNIKPMTKHSKRIAQQYELPESSNYINANRLDYTDSLITERNITSDSISISQDEAFKLKNKEFELEDIESLISRKNGDKVSYKENRERSNSSIFSAITTHLTSQATEGFGSNTNYATKLSTIIPSKHRRSNTSMF